MNDEGRPEVVEHEAEIVRRVFRMCVEEDMGASLIARRLDAEGVPMAKAGRHWYDGTIHRLLSNETYIPTASTSSARAWSATCSGYSSRRIAPSGSS